MKFMRVIIYAGVLSALLFVTSCSLFEPTQNTTTDTPNLLTLEVKDLRESNPNIMVDHNGYLIVSANLVENQPRRVILAVQVVNKSSEIIYTHPSYFILVDVNGGVHSYDSSDTTFSNTYFRGIDLPSGTHTEGGLIFELDTSIPPKSLVYNDEKTPPITLAWLDSGK